MAPKDDRPASEIAAAYRAEKAAGKRTGPRPAEEPAGDWTDSLLKKQNGKPIPCVANVITILSEHPDWKGVLAFDDLRHTATATAPPPWDAIDAPAVTTPGEWSDTDSTRLCAWLMRRYALKLGREPVAEAVAVASEQRHVHEIRDYLDGLEHDGERRVSAWLSTHLGATATPYAAAVGQWFLVSAVARIYRPGCKVDTLPVLEAPQGVGKSTAARALFGSDWFSDTPLDLENKDRFLALRGKWALEFAELDSLGRADANRIKGFLSSRADDYRPPYGRNLVHVKRSCVFIGTTNHDDYLKDETGGRRFWPVKCGRIDVDALTRDRDQIWAEAVALYRADASWWPDTVDAGLCRDEQAGRLERDPWADAVEPWLGRQFAGVPITVAEVLEDALRVEKPRQSRADAMRVARILCAAGWERRCLGPRGARVWSYRRKSEPESAS